MDKSGNQIGVSPLTRISPLTAVASVASPVQALESRADQLAKQHASLLAKIAVMKGESFPVKTTSIASVSDAAKLINQSLAQAEANGIAEKFTAQTVITHNPKLPALVSQQLRTAITDSGLFYESHLKEYMDGHRHLSAIKLEPQNQLQQVAHTLLPQQLHILEHQRLSWHGEVWPHQTMDWDVYLQNEQEQPNRHLHQDIDSTIGIASDLTLHLPLLGKVTAKIKLKNGSMHISMLVEEQETLQLLQAKRASLATAIEGNGQLLVGLAIEGLTQQKKLLVNEAKVEQNE